MSTRVPDWLMGRWRLHRAEAAVELQPDTEMELRADGVMHYRIPLPGQVAEFELSYQIEGNILHTQHVAGQQQRVSFRQEYSGMLELDFADGRAWFVRERLM